MNLAARVDGVLGSPTNNIIYGRARPLLSHAMAYVDYDHAKQQPYTKQ
jgi:hypothetical protein